MARPTVADEEALLGWLFLLAVVGVAGAAVGLWGPWPATEPETP
jgi:hypothetical protein